MTMHYSRSTFLALWVGLALTVLAALGSHLGRTMIGDHIHVGYPNLGPSEIATGVTFYLTSLTIIGALGVLGFSLTLLLAGRGSRWTRWIATGLFLTGTSVAGFVLLVRDTSGDTGLPPLIGGTYLLPSVAGLVAVVLMFRATSARTDPTSSARMHHRTTHRKARL